MKENKEVRISFLGAHFTTIVSVTLVLIIVGLIALICIGARNETRHLKERVELNVVMTDSVSDADAEAFCSRFRRLPYVRTAHVVTRSEAQDNWARDTGEDLEAAFGVNILSPEVAFTLREPYASPDSVKAITGRISRMPGVEGVAAPDAAMLHGMNDNLERLLIMLGIVGAAMLVISFVLINNTVHLTVYSRRFTIHTMQLVGATDGFIRRPFILGNMLAGLIAGLVASGILAALLGGAYSYGLPGLDECVDWVEAGVIFAGVTAGGVAICALAAWIATTRYLHKDYDQLFR